MRGFRGCPTAVVAFVLVVLVGFLERYAVWLARSPEWCRIFDYAAVLATLMAVFLAGVVFSRKRRHLLVMALLGFLAWSMRAGLYALCSGRASFFLEILPPTAIMVLISLGETWCGSQRVRRRVTWIVGTSIAAGALFAVVTNYCSMAGWSVEIPSLNWTGIPGAVKSTRICSIVSLVYWPLFAVVSWLAVGLAIHLSDDSGTALRVTGTVAIVGSLIGYVAFFGFLSFHWARTSLQGRGPFSRPTSIGLLHLRGRDSDYEFLWHELERANRDVPWYKEPLDRSGLRAVWRGLCIECLARHDGPVAAGRFSAMLREQPTQRLAEQVVEYLVEHNRYETAPILLRYALLGSEPCIAGLERMHVPEAAFALIRQAALPHAIEQALAGRMPKRFIRDYTHNGHLWEDLHPGLVRALGKDAGSDVQEWCDLYEKTVPELPTPLSCEQRREVERVETCFKHYWAVHSNWLNLRLRGLTSTTIEEPEWDVPSTADLEREIAAYSQRVEELFARGLPDSDNR